MIRSEHHGRAEGFTLIELLVVITIIVVLLSLLAPALDKAIYQAELAVCATNLKSIGTGAMTYAFEFRRRFPTRPELASTSWKPNNLYLGNPFVVGGVTTSPDFRPTLAGYFSLNGMMNDPLSGEVNFETTEPQSHIEGSYQLWFGFGYRSAAGGQGGMFRIGDRFGYGGRRFTQIVGDRDVRSLNGDFSHGSHPDADGVWSQTQYQDQTAGGGVLQLTLARWESTTTAQRGSIDMNFALADGSVDRLGELQTLADEETRLVAVPEFNDDQAPESQIWIPLR